MEELFFRRKAFDFSHGLLQNPKCVGNGHIVASVHVAAVGRRGVERNFTHRRPENEQRVGHGDLAVFVGVAVKKKCNAYRFSLAADGYLDLLGFVTAFETSRT